MSPSRREFVALLGAAGFVAGLPGSGLEALALLPPRLYPARDLSFFDTPLHRGPSDVRIGYAAITWDGKDPQAIEEISALGYPGIQLRANALKEFPDPHHLRDLLAQHHLTLVALSSGDAPVDPAKRQNTIDMHAEHARYLREAGGKYLQVAGGFEKGKKWTAADYQYEGALLNEIAKRVADLGIQTGFHNHMDSIGQTPAAVDAILAAADPRYVKLELDVAHYKQGGGDPAAAIRKHADRLLFLHLKDVKPAANSDGYEFVELGQGTVDFAAIFDALKSIHFRGWGVVELDGPRTGEHRTPKDSAQMSKRYLEQTLGVRV